MKRAVFLLFVVSAVTAGFVCLGCPAQISAHVHPYIQWAADAVQAKTVKIAGASPLAEAALKEALPLDRSPIWWRLNPRAAAEAAMQHPLVAEAQVLDCAEKAWNCFVVAVKERSARAIVQLKDGVWEVDAEGAYLRPLDRTRPLGRIEVLPTITGVDVPEQSPDLARARTRHAARCIEPIEWSSGRRVEAIMMRPNGELEVRFRGLALAAMFDAAGESMDRVSDEALRLGRLLEQFRGRESLIAQVDLAYNALAVVKLVRPAAPAAASGKS